jgi:6-phosphogluconate dehydrogenase
VTEMELGLVGFGRMGGNMARRLVRGGHRVTVYIRNPDRRAEVEAAGATAVLSLADLVAALPQPRAVWVMVPAGPATEDNLTALAGLLSPGDTLIDGGNSNFRDTLRRAEAIGAKGIHFLDAGTSGGIWGLTEGYCLMVGGPEDACRRLEPIFRTLAPEGGYLRVGPSGAGHFVKMVHNGIEYGMLQAYGEGFEILRGSPFGLDLAAIAELWRHGSVVRSWLLDLARDAFRRNPTLDGIAGYVDDSGEGRWTVLEALTENVPAPVITLSLLARIRSRQPESFSAQVIAALRNEFGGHAVHSRDQG